MSTLSPESTSKAAPPSKMEITKQYSGYDLTDLEEHAYGITARLSLRGLPVNAFGEDIKDLTLQVEYQEKDRLRVHIFDTAQQQYQIPSSLLPYPPSIIPKVSSLKFNHTPSPFSFWITRNTPSSEIIFDTRPSSIPTYTSPIQPPPSTTPKVASHSQTKSTHPVDDPPIRDTETPSHPLIFSSQYLQLSTSLPPDTNIYGLGEVIATSGLRRDTENGTVATFWNRDSGGSPHDSNLYGAHPFYLETRHSTNPSSSSKSHGVFLRNSHGMDIILRKSLLQYRILGGTIDLYFLSGPTPTSVIQQYSAITRLPAKIPYWAFGFHLCRWGYKTLEDTKRAVLEMEKAGVGLEVIWNDLDYMDRFRNWEVNEGYDLPKFKEFIAWLHSRNQHYIPIIDAAIGVTKGKDDPYFAYDEGKRLDVYIKNEDGSDFVGKVWPGATVFPDWTSPNTQSWWKSAFDRWYAQGVEYDGIWLDMNEPASFSDGFDGFVSLVEADKDEKKEVAEINGLGVEEVEEAVKEDEKGEENVLTGKDKEVVEKEKDRSNGFDFPPYEIHNGAGDLDYTTVPPSCKLADGTRVYNSHNLYGYQEVVATRKVLEEQKPGKRPFILSRSTFAGQGAVSAHWLGDNYSTWKSMRDSLQGILQFQMFQIPMVGTDACGFSGTATEELCDRWMQLAAFFPFMRNHNDISGGDQEPWRYASLIKASKTAINIRYQLLPLWESLFIQANQSGLPPLRPLFFEFNEPKYSAIDQQFLVGTGLLVTPVLHQGEVSVKGYFPSTNGTTWRDWYTHEVVKVDENEQATIKAPLGHIPLHIRSGSVVLLYNEPKLTLKETRDGSFGLVIHLDGSGKAEGEYYLDDGLDIEGEVTKVSFSATRAGLVVISEGGYRTKSVITTITVMGLDKPPKEDGAVAVTWQEDVQTARIIGLALELEGTVKIDW